MPLVAAWSSRARGGMQMQRQCRSNGCEDNGNVGSALVLLLPQKARWELGTRRVLGWLLDEQRELG